MKIAIIGPYSHKTRRERKRNVRQAYLVAVELLKLGHDPYCPHTMMEGMEHEPGLEYADFMRCTCSWLEPAEAVFLLPRWRGSEGSQDEYIQAVRQDKIMYHRLEDVPDVRADDLHDAKHSDNPSKP